MRGRARMAAVVPLAIALALAAPGARGADPRAAAASATGERSDGTQVLVVGDSVGGTLVRGLGHAGFRVVNATRWGCRLTRGAIRYQQQVGRACPWPTIWRQTVHQLHPRTVVLVSGVWDLFDVRPQRHGPWLVPGTRAWARYFKGQLVHAVKVLSSTGAHVVMPTIPYQGGHLGEGASPASSSDPARVRAANAVIAQVDRDPHNRLQAPDLNTYLSPDGRYQVGLADVPVVRADGTHFTPEGANLVGTWLAPHLSKYLGAAARRKREAGPVRVLLVGGSLTTSYEDAVASKLEAKGYSVVDNAVPGRDLLDPQVCSGALARDLVDREDPDVVVFESTPAGSTLPSARCGTSGPAGARVLLAAWSKSASRNQRVLSSRQADFFWVLSPQAPAAPDPKLTRATNAIDRRVGSDRGGLVDAWRWFGGTAPPPGLWADGRRLDAAGAARMANIVALAVR